MERGEVWWTMLDERCPVVVLSADADADADASADAAQAAGPEADAPRAGSGLQAIRVVAPATDEEKRGFLLLSAGEAADPQAVRQLVAEAGAGVAAVGIEVHIGPSEALQDAGVVRLGLPRDGQIFCTWLVTLSRDQLLERAGVLSAAKLHELDNALHLADWPDP